MSKKPRSTEDDDGESQLAPPDEPVARADEWSDVPPAEDHSAQHTELELLTQAFLANGGQIQVVDAGMRGDKVPPFNREYHQYGDQPIFDREQFKRHVNEVQRDKDKARSDKDEAVAKRLTELLPLKLGKGELLHHVGVSECVLQRVIKERFADDTRATSYLKISWAERDRAIVDSYKKLRDGEPDFDAISRCLGVKPDRLKKLLSKHGVRI